MANVKWKHTMYSFVKELKVYEAYKDKSGIPVLCIGAVLSSGQEVVNQLIASKLRIEVEGNIGYAACISNSWCYVEGNVNAVKSSNILGITESAGMLYDTGKNTNINVNDSISKSYQYARDEHCKQGEKFKVIHVEGDISALRVNMKHCICEVNIKGNVRNLQANNKNPYRTVVKGNVSDVYHEGTLELSRKFKKVGVYSHDEVGDVGEIKSKYTLDRRVFQEHGLYSGIVCDNSKDRTCVMLDNKESTPDNKSGLTDKGVTKASDIKGNSAGKEVTKVNKNNSTKHNKPSKPNKKKGRKNRH